MATEDQRKTSREPASPWPEIDDGAIAFLLDVRDDLEARLLRDWVESSRAETDALPSHTFIELPHGGAGETLARFSEQGNTVWMQPLRIAWLPAKRTPGGRSLQNFFYRRRALPGSAMRP